MRKWGRGVLAALASLLVVLSFVPLWQTDKWWVRQWDYPRLQGAALLVIVALLLAWTAFERTRGFWALAVGVAAAIGWQVSHFFAYVPPYPREVKSAETCPAGRSLSLLNANVLQTNKNYRALLDLVAARDPDVLLLLETGPDWRRAIAPLAAEYSYRLIEPAPATYGMMLLSRLPMNGQIHHRLQPAVPSISARIKLAGGQQVDFHALHPEPPWPGDDSGERDAELISVGREVRNSGRASIVMGDLNDVAWSRTSRLFKDVSATRDPRVGRGFYSTFDANYPLLRWPLDHLFVSPHFEVMEIDRLRDIGSDHFPMFFRLCLTDRAVERQIAPNASAATEAKASEEIGEGKAEKVKEDRGR